MKLNFLFYSVMQYDGYGRYSPYLIRALRRAGVTVIPHFIGAADAPDWLRNEWGIDWTIPTISCLPPFYLRKVPGRHWLITMTEGSDLPLGWREIIESCNVDHLIVPCQHNAEAFARGGVACPISVIPGGTDPDEFPLRTDRRSTIEPYTFLCLADRGDRKGWYEVYAAFYKAFGGKTTGVQDVRLIIKARPTANRFLDRIATAEGLDKRLVFMREDYDDMAELYALADCVAIPSRSEGWGMPQREAAMMGLPVITQAYAGLDDGHTHEWAIVVAGGPEVKIAADEGSHVKGMYRLCDVDDLATRMRFLYDNPSYGVEYGQHAAAWLRTNQTWDHSAARLIALLQQEGVFEPERELA